MLLRGVLVMFMLMMLVMAMEMTSCVRLQRDGGIKCAEEQAGYSGKGGRGVTLTIEERLTTNNGCEAGAAQASASLCSIDELPTAAAAGSLLLLT